MSTHAHTAAHSEHAPHPHGEHAEHAGHAPHAHAEHAHHAHVEAANENHADEAAREPIPAPEQSNAAQIEAQAHALREPPHTPEGVAAVNDSESLVPHEPPPVVPPKPQSIAGSSVPAVDAPINLVVRPVDFKVAEEKLADYLGRKITPPELTDGLVLTLKEFPNNHKAGLELCFQSPKLISNSALLGEQVLAALKEHKAFKIYFDSKESVPTAVKPQEPEKADMLHIQIPNLTMQQYSLLVGQTVHPDEHSQAVEVPVLHGTHVAPDNDTVWSDEYASHAVPAVPPLQVNTTHQGVVPEAANNGQMGAVHTEEKLPSVQHALEALQGMAPPPQIAAPATHAGMALPEQVIAHQNQTQEAPQL